MPTLSRTRKSVKPKTSPVVSLVLAIDHQCYGLTPIAGIGDPDVVRAWRLAKKGADGAVYDVAATVHGLQCDCPDFILRRDGIDRAGCKHVKACVASGLLDAPTPAARHDDALPPCCPTGEPRPCTACIGADSLTTGEGIECDESESAGDPSTWGPEWDADIWELGPEPAAPEPTPAPRSRFEPSEDDRAWWASFVARRSRVVVHGLAPSSRCTEATDGPGIPAFGHHA